MANISVIVPVYNVEKYLDRCIKSIINQTFEDIEIILVNDGSTDRSGDICDEYKRKDSRIKVIHQNNKGVSNARNKGILEASGDYIQFVDSDDWIEKEFCENVYNQIYKYNPDIIFTGFILEDDHGNLIREKIPNKNFINSNEDLKIRVAQMYNEGLLGYSFTNIYRKDILDKYNIKFNESMNLFEDEEFIFNYFKYVKNAIFLENSYYHYIKYGVNEKTLSNVENKNASYFKELAFKRMFELVSDLENEDCIKLLIQIAYVQTYYRFCNIVLSGENLINKVEATNKLKKTSFYKYLSDNSSNKYIKRLLYYISNNSYFRFKIFNRIILSKKKVV